MWRQLAGPGSHSTTLAHAGKRRPSGDELVVLLDAVLLEFFDPWIFSFEVGVCDDVPPSRSCVTAAVAPGTRPFHVARRLDLLLGGKDDELCYDVKISAQVEVFADDGSCLPVGFRGPLQATRGTWRLYADRPGNAFLLEHVGETLAIDEHTVAALRERVPKAIVDGRPIDGLGYGLCGTDVHPRRGVCVQIDQPAGTDLFHGAEVLERALGPAAFDLCYGVRLIVGTPVLSREDVPGRP